MQIYYLEIVTPDVERLCQVQSAATGSVFSDPLPELGQARVADLAGGGRMGVRAPMSPEEEPAVRTYVLVDDIDAATKAAQDNGAEVIHPPLEIPGQGWFSICLTAGVQHGFWQL